MTKVSLVLACIVAAVVAEPPVPQGQYPPSSQYGTPSGQLGLSGQYGVPGRFGGNGRPGQQQQQGYPSGPSGNGFSPSGYAGNGEDGNGEPANYEFKYDVEAPEYNVNFGHEEARQGDVAQGKYYVLLPDGRTQLVEYVADQDGYRPKISYEGGEDQNGYGSGPNGQGGYSSGGPNGQGGYSSGGPNSQGGYANGGFGAQGGYANGGSNGQGGYSRGGPGGYSS